MCVRDRERGGGEKGRSRARDRKIEQVRASKRKTEREGDQGRERK